MLDHTDLICSGKSIFIVKGLPVAITGYRHRGEIPEPEDRRQPTSEMICQRLRSRDFVPDRIETCGESWVIDHSQNVRGHSLTLGKLLRQIANRETVTVRKRLERPVNFDQRNWNSPVIGPVADVTLIDFSPAFSQHIAFRPEFPRA